MSTVHHVYLIPGFFGFVNFGRLVYFAHVREFLEDRLEALGLQCVIHRTRPSPTASLRKRAAELHRYIVDTGPAHGPLHLVGHSSGGLDARLVASPGVSLPGVDEVEPVAARLASVITISTPHYGTPLASLLTGFMGQRLLRLLSLATVETLREGRLPLSLVARIGATLARVGLPGSRAEVALDELYEQLIQRIPQAERDSISGFFDNVSLDQGILPQITPEGLDLFNASCSDRPDLYYACVVSGSPPPTLRTQWSAGPNPYTQATYLLYRLLYRLIGNASVIIDTPPYSPAQKRALARVWHQGPGRRDNDGIVPTRSQVRGEVIYAAQGDHLDVIGHFDGEGHRPPHHDWLATGAGFDRAAFEELWGAVAAAIAGAVRR